MNIKSSYVGGNVETAIIRYVDDSEFIITKKYDDRRNLIHHKESDGYEYWQEFDEKNRVISFKSTRGVDCWYSYDEKGYKYYKDSNGLEFDYDDTGKVIRQKFT
jgi:antibiotic biosynthesis monooxygenase (ABM) superfamily enzyme